MEVIHQLLVFRSMGQWKRQRWYFVIVTGVYFVSFLIATTQVVEIVTGFNNQQRSVPPNARSTRGCFTKASLWSAKTRRRTFVRLQQTRRRLQMQHSENAGNSTSTSSVSTSPNATTQRSTKMYDLGVGKHPPLSSSTNSSTTIISNLSSSVADIQSLKNNSEVVKQSMENSEDALSNANNSTVSNARLLGMNWMAPESVVKPSYMMINTTSTTTTIDQVQKQQQQQQYLEQNTNAEKKSRRMVAYVFQTKY